MDKRTKGVYVLVCCPSIITLRRLIESEDFRDCPVDKFIEKRISDTIEELLTAVINYETSFDSMYDLVLDEIITFLSHYVNIHGIQGIVSWYDDTLLIHCAPSGVKHVNSS